MTDPGPQAYRQRVYEIQNDDRSLSETLEGILEVAVEYLDVSNGHVKRTYPERGVHRVVATAGSTDIADVGDSHDHERTFCRQTLRMDSPLALANVPETDWADDPASTAHDLDCYVGTALTVGRDPYGTACFVADVARAEEFSPADLSFVEFVGRVVETEVTVGQYTRKLENRDRLLATLSRVLRHNLRNDMNVIRGTARNLTQRLDGEDSEAAAVVVDTATHLVELGEEARSLEGLLEDETPPEPVDVAAMAEGVARDRRTDDPTGTVELTAPDTMRVLGTEHLRTALSELVDNALRYAGPDPTAGIVIDTTDENTVTVTVSDDGPGLPPSERRILRGVEETQVAHGQGLGLWLVYWAVADVGGHVSVDVDDGTDITIHLCRVDGAGDADEWAGDLYLEEATLW